MKNYYVESAARWFVVAAANKRKARAVGISEYGHGNVLNVREATQKETEYFVSQKGKDALR